MPGLAVRRSFFQHATFGAGNALDNVITGNAYKPNGPNNFSGGAGFSATVFKSNTGAQYTIAVRGTEFAASFNQQDIIEDALGVALAGKAVNQVIAAYRYYKQLTTVSLGVVSGFYYKRRMA